MALRRLRSLELIDGRCESCWDAHVRGCDVHAVEMQASFSHMSRRRQTAACGGEKKIVKAGSSTSGARVMCCHCPQRGAGVSLPLQIPVCSRLRSMCAITHASPSEFSWCVFINVQFGPQRLEGLHSFCSKHRSLTTTACIGSTTSYSNLSSMKFLDPPSTQPCFLSPSF